MTVDQKVISLQEKIKDLAFEEIGEIFNFSSDYYGGYLLGLVDDFIETEEIPEKIASALVPHFISWAVSTATAMIESRSLSSIWTRQDIKEE